MAIIPRCRFWARGSDSTSNALEPGPRWAFIVVRMLGLVVLVPLIEELFWRSFLIRWLIDPDFQKVPIGRVTPMAAAVTSVVFALVHPEWLPALLTGALWAWLLWQTRSLDRLRGQPCHGQPRAGNLRDRHRRLEILVESDDHPLGDRCADLPPADRHDRDDRRQRARHSGVSVRHATRTGRWSWATACTRSSG